MTDTVFIRNLVLFGRHGVFAEEQVLGQRFHLDIAVETDLSGVGRSDELRGVINYVQVIEEVRCVFEGQTFKLIEALAECVAARLLEVFPAAFAVAITVRKPHAAINAQFDSVEISIYRTRA
jgi:dihydroneopterin aldolase